MFDLHTIVLFTGGGIMVLWANSIYELRLLRRGSYLEMHHAYTGALLLLAPTAWHAAALLCWIIGLWLLVDDAVQHETQIARPYYRSPIHRWYVRAVRWLRARGVL